MGGASAAGISRSSNPLPNAFCLAGQVLHQMPHVMRDPIDDAEDFLQNVSDQIRRRNAEIVCKEPDILCQLLGDPRMQNAFFACIPSVFTAPGAPGTP
jgi:hypothetical protein